MKLSKTI